MTPEEVLAAVPQQEPFRFIDEILELGEDHIVAAYTFRPISISIGATSRAGRSRPE